MIINVGRYYQFLRKTEVYVTSLIANCHPYTKTVNRIFTIIRVLMATIQTSSYTHIIALDFGTSGCGIAVWNKSTAPSIDNIHLFSNWFKKNPVTMYKCPTILLLDHEERVEAFGLEAMEKYHTKRVVHVNKIEDYYLFTRFKMDLYNKKVSGGLWCNCN